jgi:CubicO group peptidase (beta-lactamase class C family)
MRLLLVMAWLMVTSMLLACSNSQDEFVNAIQHAEKEITAIHVTSLGSIVLISGKNHSFLSASQRVTQQSQFYIGSLTRQMTAFIMLHAVQKYDANSDLDVLLNKKIIDLFPHSRLLKAVDRTWVNQITLLDLMTHRSGLSDYIDYYQHDLNDPSALNNPIDPV